MVPHLMICHTCMKVKEALILEFGSSKALSRHKQAFVDIHLKAEEAASAFDERFYCEAQVPVTCGNLIWIMLLRLPSPLSRLIPTSSYISRASNVLSLPFSRSKKPC